MPVLQLRRIDEAVGAMSSHAGDDAPKTLDERRDTAREPARDLCEIVVDNARFAISCLAHNISATGALLESSSTDVPDRFILANHAKRMRTVCRVVWRCGRMMGVRFATQPRPFD